MKKHYIVFSIILLALYACSDGSPPQPEQACLYTITEVEDFTIVEPEACNIVFNLSNGTTRSKSFSPVSSNNPAPEPEDYFFMVREGSSTNLLINFMGGGACWSGTNCLDYVTNYVYDDIKVFSPELITAATLPLFHAAFGGIIDDTHPDNPFKDWTLVFLPYTTADVHWGSNDQEYTDDNGNEVTVYHRGFDNFLSALRYIRDNYPPETTETVFVTGQSAGSYGAIFNFPYIKESYPDSIVHILGDGGSGVNPQSFINDSINSWNVKTNLPDWIDGIEKDDFGNMSMGSIYKAVADYYPDSNVAQYTTMYDTNQRFFYYVMLEIDNPDAWNSLDGSGFDVPDMITCDWTADMLAQKNTAEEATNYKAYVAPGDTHTITTSDDMFTMSADGVDLLDWINLMLDDDPDWHSIVCSDCDEPATGESPDGISCL